MLRIFKKSIMLMVCAAVAAAIAACPAPAADTAVSGERFPPASYDPRAYGRVGEEIMVLMHPAKPGDIIIVVERFAEPVDRYRYFQYAGVEGGAIRIEVVEKSVNASQKIDRVDARKTLTLPMTGGNKAYFDAADFYDKPFKTVLVVKPGDNSVTIQVMREREVVVLDHSDE